MTTRITGISFETSLLTEVDTQRGLIPRSTYISKIVDNHLKNQREVQFSRPDLSLKTSRDEGNDRG